MNKNIYTYDIEADIKNLPAFLNSMEKFLKLHNIARNKRYAIILSTEEAVANIIHHAYHNKDKGPVKVTCHIGKDQVAVSIIDHGTRFDPEKVPPPDLTPDINKRKIGGLGMVLIKHFMDSVSYSFFENTGNQLVMTKSLKKHSGRA
jgi:anti-sigma regulatory factor (Ser/Thr protein kinase)